MFSRKYPKPFTYENKQQLRKLHSEGFLQREIADQMDKPISTIGKYEKILGLKREPKRANQYTALRNSILSGANL